MFFVVACNFVFLHFRVATTTCCMKFLVLACNFLLFQDPAAPQQPPTTTSSSTKKHITTLILAKAFSAGPQLQITTDGNARHGYAHFPSYVAFVKATKFVS